MQHADNATLASVCRAQASIASSAEAKAVLLDMADLYDAEEEPPLVVELQEAPPEQVERAPDTLA